MRKKNLLTMALALVLVGAVGVGATLAYLSDSTTELKNTFTVGSGIDITQDEEDIDYDYDEDDDGKVDEKYDEDGDGKVDEGKEGRTEIGNDYTDILPGDVLVKDPTVTVKANSTDCYVFMQLTNADELAAIKVKDADGNDVAAFAFGTEDANGNFVAGLSSDWTKVAGEEGTLDGLYVYKNYEVQEKAAADNDLTPLFTRVQYNINADLTADVDLADVLIKSCAVQADNMTEAEALAAAQDTIE